MRTSKNWQHQLFVKYCKIICNCNLQNIRIYYDILPRFCGCTWVDDNDFLDN